jgi:hypothetical protein
MMKRKTNRYLLAVAGLGISVTLAMPVYARHYSSSECDYRAERAAQNTYGAVGGAVVGAAAGAGIGAIQDNEKKKAAAQSRDAYQHEYQNCLNAKGF